MIKGIEILQTMKWSKLCWDQSFKDIIELDILLPKIGHQYPITLCRNENFAVEGQAFVLWQPPHSELNGWWDKRPSEILKSYVVEGELTNRCLSGETHGLSFEIRVSAIYRLVDCFSKFAKRYSSPNESPLPYLGQSNILSKSGWKNHWEIDSSWEFKKYKIGNYIYLMGSGSEYMSEAIFSYEGDRLYLHYAADFPSFGSYRTIITKYCLTHNEQNLVKNILLNASKIVDSSYALLRVDQIYGAEYW